MRFTPTVHDVRIAKHIANAHPALKRIGTPWWGLIPANKIGFVTIGTTIVDVMYFLKLMEIKYLLNLELSLKYACKIGDR